jgi:hypothetical protein
MSNDKFLEPTKIISVADEDGNEIDFWVIQDASTMKVHVALHCSQSMVESNVLDALEYFVEQCRTEGIGFLDQSSKTRH